MSEGVRVGYASLALPIEAEEMLFGRGEVSTSGVSARCRGF